MPLLPGMRTSRIRQPGTLGSFVLRNSSAETNVRAFSPTDRIRLSMAFLTATSSSTMYTIGSCSAISIGLTDGQRELESCALSLLRCRPQAPAVRFHNRPADGEPHAEPSAFRREEGSKKLIQVLGIDSCSGIMHGDHNFVCVQASGRHQQFSRTVPRCPRSLESI